MGSSLLLPGGWCTKTGGHALVYAVRRHQTHYSLAVTNCGDGLVRVFPNSKSRTTVCP